MSRDFHSRAADEEAGPTTQGRFNAMDSFHQLEDVSPLSFSQPAEIDSDVPPTTSKHRRRASSLRGSLDQDAHLCEKITTRPDDVLLQAAAAKKSVFYLAYGSNLASQTFLGKRGIKPLSQILVLVPELQLTFNLPGLPYTEPCFATTQYRDPNSSTGLGYESEGDTSESGAEYLSEKAPLISEIPKCSRTRGWDKPLIGVVYEVTLADYAKIIASEGGGGGYRDIVIDCYPFPDDYKSTDPVPNHPDTPAFKAHTLLSQGADSVLQDKTGQNDHTLITPASRFKSSVFNFSPHMRPNLNYAQPSSRYLNLIITGASEHDLPVSYQKYLSEVHPYQITTFRQKLGKTLITFLWGPIILFLLGLCKKFGGADGLSPPWLVSLLNFTFAAMWKSYDWFFKGAFGDGERTIDS